MQTIKWEDFKKKTSPVVGGAVGGAVAGRGVVVVGRGVVVVVVGRGVVAGGAVEKQLSGSDHFKRKHRMH